MKPQIGDVRINCVFAWRPRLLEKFTWLSWYWTSEQYIGNGKWIELHASKHLKRLKTT